MTAVTAALASTSQKMSALCAGPVNVAGASIKVIKITPGTYEAAGEALDLSAFFPDRVYWATVQSGTVKNATTGYIQVGLAPGSAKSDGNGFAPTGWKVVASTGASEQIVGDISAYVFYIIVCGI